MTRRALPVVTLMVVVVLIPARAQNRHVRLADVRQLMVETASLAPAALGGEPSDAKWDSWIERRDREIRDRLVRGDEDTLVNWMLLGTSFTMQPPVVLDASAGDAGLARMAMQIAGRSTDLLRAVQNPGDDDRRLFARALFETQGFDIATGPGAEGARAYLLNLLGRVLPEWTALNASAGDPHQFRTRGLSLDTSLQSNYGVEAALNAMVEQQSLRVAGIRRVAVIGAGLDVADKNSGFDFYPPQTLQPVAVLEALARIGAANATNVELVALDVSPRVLAHVARAQASAVRGGSYAVQLALDRNRPWLPGLRDYWRSFGTRLGAAVPTVRPRSAGKGVDAADVRSVRFPPAVVRRVSGRDFNVVTDRVAGETFDLIVATNVFLYYDRFEQALALANVRALLRPGGLLLSNTALPEIEASGMQRTGALRLRYTSDGAGDEMIWYQRTPPIGTVSPGSTAW